jgi:hypothetical protein
VLRLTLATFVVLALPAAASAQTALSEADQQRVVCVSKRDAAGKKIDGEICQTGRDWQRWIARAPIPAKYRTASRQSTSRIAAGHLAYPHYFKASPY